MKNKITLGDKTFHLFIRSEDMKKRTAALATRINIDYEDKKPLFLAVLNGAFMFASDLMKEVSINSEISFVKVASYEGMESSGQVKQLLGINENLKGRDVVIIEDIVDTGKTITSVYQQLKSLGVKSLETVTLLRKPHSKNLDIPIKYIAFDIEDRFVVGYGLDYNGLGRNINAIYQYID